MGLNLLNFIIGQICTPLFKTLIDQLFLSTYDCLSPESIKKINLTVFNTNFLVLYN